jgi:hypothetical protein
MAKTVNTAVLDLALNDIKTNGNKMVVCSSQPTTYAEANSTFMLANVAMTSTDYTLAAGDTSGRKVTTGSKTGISISTSGTATHVAIIDTTNSILKLVTTCTSQALSTGGTVDIPAWKWEINNPT